jgi:hypothetical protein
MECKKKSSTLIVKKLRLKVLLKKIISEHTGIPNCRYQEI